MYFVMQDLESYLGRVTLQKSALDTREKKCDKDRHSLTQIRINFDAKLETTILLRTLYSISARKWSCYSRPLDSWAPWPGLPDAAC